MIFLDNASTTKVREDVLQEYIKYSSELFFNPSAPYRIAGDIKKLLNKAEKDIINYLNGDSNGKLIFTSCATESNNTAILCNLNKRYKKVLISAGEHSSVISLIDEIRNRGFEVELINLNKNGTIDLDDFKIKMQSDVGLVCVMQVSNETGAINPISDLVKICKTVNPNCFFHCDGTQAMCKFKIDLKQLGVDSFAFSGHKFNAPKGVAGLYVRKQIKPFLLGGGQQSGMRSGTENVAGIMALTYAILNSDIEGQFQYVSELNNLARTILSGKEGIFINSPQDASPFVLSLSFEGVNGATLVNMLDEEGVCLGTGSACSTKKAGNQTLQSMGLSNAQILGSVRMSFSKDNTKAEVEYACEKLIQSFERLRKIVRR